jgi:hypothetical protein
MEGADMKSIVGLVLSTFICGSGAWGVEAKGFFTENKWTDSFTNEAPLEAVGVNPYFNLEPGFVLEYENSDTRLVITVLDETKVVDGVKTAIVEEREWHKGKLAEVSRNFFAIDKRSNSVFYFGEDVDNYKNDKVTGNDGSWLSGVKGAHWGLVMPGTVTLGSRYYQEVCPGVAMDRAEIVGIGETVETVETPAGKFTNCLRTEETTPLEKGKSTKVYAPGIGLICDGDLKLTKYGKKAK